MYSQPREPSTAYSLHQTLSANARTQTSLAISLDESCRFREALVIYNRATELLSSYLRSFSDSAPGFQKLTQGERAVVIQTRKALAKHLQSVEARRTLLRTSASAGEARAAAVRTRDGTRAHPARVEAKGASQGTAATVGSKLSRDDPLVQSIESEILVKSSGVDWDDIYGLGEAKRALHEMVVLPALRPDLYTGLRAPGKGILLYGPPGTGKSMIAKAVATNAKATFFSISASSLNSKFHGESERLVRTLFLVARERQPSFIFIDEVDSILGARGDNEHEASRRLKTEFMAQFDGAGGDGEERVYVMAASNRPQDLDDAVRRRLDRRIYVPLPDMAGRQEFFKKLTSKNDNVRWALRQSDFEMLAKKTEDFSGSDIKAFCREASLMPLRELGTMVSAVKVGDVRAVTMRDFEEALQIVRPSSNKKQIAELESWDRQFGSHASGPKKGKGNRETAPGEGRTSRSDDWSLAPAQSTRSKKQGKRNASLSWFNM